MPGLTEEQLAELEQLRAAWSTAEGKRKWAASHCRFEQDAASLSLALAEEVQRLRGIIERVKAHIEQGAFDKDTALRSLEILAEAEYPLA